MNTNIDNILDKYNKKFKDYLEDENNSDYLEDYTKIYVCKDKNITNAYEVKFNSIKHIPHENEICLINFGVSSFYVPDITFDESVSLYLLGIIHDLSEELYTEHYFKNI